MGGASKAMRAAMESGEVTERTEEMKAMRDRKAREAEQFNPLHDTDDEMSDEEEEHQQETETDTTRRPSLTEDMGAAAAQLVEGLDVTPVDEETETPKEEPAKTSKSKGKKKLNAASAEKLGHTNIGKIDEEVQKEAQRIRNDQGDAAADKFLDQHIRVAGNKTIFGRNILKRTFGVAGMKGKRPYMKYSGRKTDENAKKFAVALGAASALSALVGGGMAIFGGKWSAVKIPVAIAISTAIAGGLATGALASRTDTEDEILKERLDEAIQSNNEEEIDKILLEISTVYPDLVARSVDKTLKKNPELKETLDEAGQKITEATNDMEPSEANQVNDAAADAVEKIADYTEYYSDVDRALVEEAERSRTIDTPPEVIALPNK